jgi:type VI secretion system protein VasD
MVAKLKKDGDPRSWKKIYGVDNRDLKNVEVELKRGKLDSIAISFIPTSEMNADSSGNPLPATVRIYKLKSVENFKSATFNSLWKKGSEILGDELIDMETINVYPDRPQKVTYKRNQETKYFGLAAIFRNPESDDSWKKIIEISDKKYDEIEELKTYLYRNSIEIQP